MQHLKNTFNKFDKQFKAAHERMFQWHLLKLSLATYTFLNFIQQINITNPLTYFIVLASGIALVNLLFAKPYVYHRSTKANIQNKGKEDSNLLKLHKCLYKAHNFKFYWLSSR